MEFDKVVEAAVFDSIGKGEKVYIYAARTAQGVWKWFFTTQKSWFEYRTRAPKGRDQ